MVCEGFKPIGRHTLRRCGTSPLDCFFFEKGTGLKHTHTREWESGFNITQLTTYKTHI